MSRAYAQNCGLARSLDVLGERWTLLVVRELMLGPRRYRDLQDALPGIGTNLLAARLKSLQSAGVLRRTTLPPPAGVGAYELTERGEGLRPAVEDLFLWGFALIPLQDNEDLTRASWMALTMRAVLARADGPVADGVFGFEVGDEAFWLHIHDGEATLRQGPAPLPVDAGLHTDMDTYLALGLGRERVRDAAREGRAEVSGDRAALERLLRTFRLPV
jgi:DNA-binding HxlR family transcriptional regulator